MFDTIMMAKHHPIHSKNPTKLFFVTKWFEISHMGITLPWECIGVDGS